MKKTFINSRQIFAMLVTILLFMVALNSCQKDLITENQPTITKLKSHDLLAQSQWYNKNNSITKSEENWLRELGPNWDNAIQITTDKQIVYELTLNNPKHIFIATGSVDKTHMDNFEKRNAIRLLIFEDQITKARTSCFMSLVAGESFDLKGNALDQIHYKNYKDFTGIVNFYELDGSLTNGWSIVKGKINGFRAAATGVSLTNTLAKGKTMSAQLVPCGTTTEVHYRQECIQVGDGGNGANGCTWSVYYTTEVVYCNQDEGGGDGGDGGYTPPHSPPPPSEPEKPEYVCNCNCSDNDAEMVDAELSYEPKWGQLGNLASIKNEVNKLINQTSNFNSLSLEDRLLNLKNYFNANRSYERNQSGNLVDKQGSKLIDRYIYTENSGWIDMHHFFYAAFLTEAHSITYAFTVTTGAEYVQSKLNSQQASAFSYEDLPSNYAGINFWKQYGTSISNGTNDFNSAITGFFNQLNAKEPSEAPNYDYIPHIIDNFAPKNTTSKGLVGDVLRSAAKESFCKKSVQIQQNIKEAHSKLNPSAH